MRERLQNDLNERKLTIKRRYTELHPAKEVGASARVRNKVLEAIKDGKITKAEFDRIISELSTDSKRWLKRNAQYFNVSEDGVTLSKSGSRILNQIKTNTQPTMRKLVMESFNDFMNSQENEIINEGTRGQVGIIDKKGNIQSVYTHYDSYPDWVLPTIKKHYKNAKAVRDLIAKGDNSGLDAPGKMNFYGDGREPMSGKSSKIDQYIKLAASEGGAEYAYLYDESDKTWYMVDIYGDRELVPAFESVVNEKVSKAELKKMVKSLKKAGHDAKIAYWGTGIVVRDEDDGTVEYSWDPEDGIFADDAEYLGADHSYDKFIDIIEYPEDYEGEFWESKQISEVNEKISKAELKKMVKKFQKAGYEAEIWMNTGVSVRGEDVEHLGGNMYRGTGIMVDYLWHPEEGIYADDYEYTGDDHSFDKFLDIVENPHHYEGQWESNQFEVNEALKSSKLRNLMNMQAAGTKYGSHNKDLTKAFYGLTKIKLDKLEDSAFIDYADPKKAYKELSKDRDYVVFYIVDNEKSNPHAAVGSWGYETVKPGLLALTRGKDFLGVSYDQRETQRDRAARGGKYGSYKKTLSKAETDAVGGSKKYSGYEGSGISSIKRAAELADRAIALHLSSGTSADSDRSARTKAREGAIAFTSGKDFKKANLARYNEILQNKAAALPLDKVVEDSINLLTKHITDAFKSGEKTQYGETKIGVDKRGREIKVTDASNIMSNLLNDYDRYVRYLTDAEKEKDSGYSTGYYEKNAKQYAKSIKDRAKKIKDMDYAW